MRRLLGEPRFPGHDIKERCASQPCIVLTKSDSTSAAIPPPPDAQTCDLDDLSKASGIPDAVSSIADAQSLAFAPAKLTKPPNAPQSRESGFAGPDTVKGVTHGRESSNYCRRR